MFCSALNDSSLVEDPGMVVCGKKTAEFLVAKVKRFQIFKEPHAYFIDIGLTKSGSESTATVVKVLRFNMQQDRGLYSQSFERFFECACPKHVHAVASFMMEGLILVGPLLGF